MNWTSDNVYHPILGMNIDSNGIGNRPQECVDCLNIDILQSGIRPRRGFQAIQNSGTEPTETIIHYEKYIDPSVGTILFGFAGESIWKFVPGAGWQDVTGVSLAGLGIDQWITTPCIDDTVGATIVASGSQFIPANSAMGGGTERALLYYDQSTDEFKTLNMTADRLVTEEDTTVITPTAPAVAVSAAPLSATSDIDFVQIEPGSVNFYTVLGGSLARAGNVVFDNGGTPAYHLIPADDTVVAYGANSWVNVDGSAWSIAFVGGTVGNAILVDYTYSRDVDYAPMHVVNFQNALVFSHTYEESVYFPWRIRYSVQGNIFKTKEIYFQDLAVDDISPIIRMAPLNFAYYNTVDSYIYIYKLNSIVRASYNRGFNADPDLVQPFLNFETAYPEGLEAGRTIVSVKGAHIFMGRNDVYLFNGTERISLTYDRETGATRIRDFLFDNVDIDDIKFNFGVYDELKQRYMLFVRRLGDSGTYTNSCFVYYVDRGVWTRYTTPDTSAGIAIDLNPGGSINNLVGNIQDLEGPIEDLGGAARKLVIFAMLAESYYLSSPGSADKGTSVAENYIITRDFFGETLQHQDRFSLGYLEGRGGSVTISHNPDYSLVPGEFLQEQTVTFTSVNKRTQYNPDVISNSLRLKLSLDPGSKLRWLQMFSNRQELTNI